ncbi:hypothetical protein CENSYa_0997 [Cenarchaeum symbiosum A]|uniref:Uncharacterized protein n=1 Tax=Cenarchaeum symbiosum (strain A) TaxID=414004 RepID=A0RWB2_CENSY|nr:hypothetical protein CENSYa_0997 [Cenarchaeum symbiosum A]
MPTWTSPLGVNIIITCYGYPGYSRWSQAALSWDQRDAVRAPVAPGGVAEEKLIGITSA